MFRTFFLLLTLLLSSNSIYSAPLSRDEVPEPLEPWVDWVLQDDKQKTCPFIYNNSNSHRCAWPTRLDLSLLSTTGEFSIIWHVYQKSWVTLPGDPKHWPVDVTDNGTVVSVTSHRGRPALMLEPGNHEIVGKFEWNSLPNSLTIPPDTGLVSLNVNHKTIDFPDIKPGKRGAQIWLKERQATNTGRQGEQIKLEVYRHLRDAIPFEMTTKINLQVSGKQREVIIGKPLLTNTIPLKLISELPARLEPDGNLRVQLRPGRWTIDLVSRFPDQVTNLTLADQKKPWPDAEVWVFAAQNQLRLVEVEGAISIDPRQTQMPDFWRQYPAYRMMPGESLSFKIIRRGDPEPEPDALTLNRNLWLDQSGKGFTINDTINGRMTQGWRLEATETLDLGRVILDNEPQFITRLSNKKGVEVRRGSINLSADSRYEGDITKFNAVGWDHDFRQVNATLHLPPGWKLFSASGVDTVPNTWLQRWTLLDLFLVLITAIAISRLWNWQLGLLALITLTLIWHESGAPQQIWLHIIAAIALLRVLPAGKFRWLVTSYRNLALLGLVLISIPFMISEVKIGLFPQLEYPWQNGSVMNMFEESHDGMAQSNMGSMNQMAKPMAPQVEAQIESDEEIAVESKISSRSRSVPVSSPYNKSKFPVQFDAKTNIQTGPGLPYWQWNKIPLHWNGPVEKDQQVDLTLMSPRLNLFLNILRVLLLAGLALLIAGAGKCGKGRCSRSGSDLNPSSKNQSGKAAAMLLVPILFAINPQDSMAEMPTPELLEELRSRLLTAPECLPACAHASRMQIDINPEDLQLRIEIHTVEDVIVPLPGKSGKWLPTQVAVNGEPAEGLYKDKNGQLWIHLPEGVHQLILFGQLPDLNSVDLALPLRPSRVTVETEGWDIVGIHEDGVPDQQLKLTRIKGNSNTSSTTLETATLPPFVKIHRTLRLGLDWRIETRVERTSPAGSAIVIKVPLLEGESILTDGFRVKDKHVLINMSANQSSMKWESSLKSTNEISLTAPKTTQWTEIWDADISPIWHMESSGIAVVHHQNPDGHWLPEWRPWPGESITLKITRPEGIDGQTLTIDNSELTINPGQRATDVDLMISLRSSQGGQHTITLPEQARLQSVTIDGRSQPIRQSGQQVTLPVHPGKQIIKLNWRTSEGIHNLQRTPEVDLGTPSVNSAIKLNPGDRRWVLFAGGPQWGPAVLFWGILIVIILVSVGLGRVKLTPLRTWEWILLGIGLSQAPIFAAVLVAAWLMALGVKNKLGIKLSKTNFNLIQIGLGILTFVALSALFEAIKQGLLGSPNMQISGNNSTAYALNWYQDRVTNIPAQAWIFSVPLLAYRILMLLWSLWLAFALLRWLRWGWESFSKDGIWQPFQLKYIRKNKKPETTQNAE